MHFGLTTYTVTNIYRGLKGYAYQYDQLQRIRQSHSFSTSNGTSWTRDGANNSYDENYKYDPNGNILKLNRRGASGLMDSLTYYYYSGQPNTLNYIQDSVSYSSSLNMTNQSSGNYSYNAIGNLVSDAGSYVSAIAWDVYNKIAKVTYTGPGGPKIHKFDYDGLGQRKMRESMDSTDANNKNFIRDYYIRDPQGNVICIYKDTVTIVNGSVTKDIIWQTELPVYGSDRVGDYFINRQVSGSGAILKFKRRRSEKQYELKNHMGNVLVTISDKKKGIGNLTANYYQPEVKTVQDYYNFGQVMDGARQLNISKYRYGFNGKEEDPSFSSLTNYDYGFRIYNPSIGRFLSVDPLTRSYAWYTPYQFAGNKPIIAIDLDGLEEKIVINSIYKAAPTQFYDQNGELQSTPNYFKISQEFSKDHVMYSAYANNQKYGTEGVLTLDYYENEKVAENYNSGNIDKFIDQGIKLSERVEKTGDAIVFGSAALVLITEGASAPGVVAGGVISLAGMGSKNFIKLFVKKGNAADDIIDLTVDATFELLPNVVKTAVEKTKLDVLTKEIIKAQANKTAIVGEKAAEKIVEDKRQSRNGSK